MNVARKRNCMKILFNHNKVLFICYDNLIKIGQFHYIFDICFQIEYIFLVDGKKGRIKKIKISQSSFETS